MAAMAAVVMSSCSSDEVVNNYSQDNAIEFGTYVGRDAVSRGQIITTKELGEQGFGVFAYYTGTDNYEQATSKANFMYNQKVEKATDAEYSEEEGKYSKWSYTPVKYWPNNTNDKVTFFAYAPYNEKYSSENGAITFEVNSNIKQQIDLLWNSEKHVDETKQTVNGTVDFVFSHALSRIAFTVQAAVDEVDVTDKALDENTTITVHKVTLQGNDNVNDENLSGAFYTSGSLNLNTYSTEGSTDPVSAAWTPGNTVQAFELTKSHFVKGEDEEGNKEEQDFVLTSANSVNKNQLTDTDSYLMVIPQDFSASSETYSTQKLYVCIEYTVKTTDPNREDELNNSEIKNIITTEAPINFESGKAYSINLCLGMTSVKLEATVAEWQEKNEEVNLPENKSEE